METKFPKFDDDFPSKWSMFFHVGTEWLQNFQLLDDEREKPEGIFLFWVYPHVLYFSLELFVKSLASHENAAFDAKKDKFGHSATAIIKAYESKIPLFAKIAQNQKLFDLIKEYEKTLDTRFGETAVQLDRSDTKLMLDTVHELREEMCKRTGLK
jgi:predicted DNA-binding protein YlxM (UPF0122 family)